MTTTARFREHPPEPYSLANTIATFARFPDELVDLARDGRYQRLFETPQALILARAEQEHISGGDSSVIVTLRAATSVDPAQLETTALPLVRHVLALDEDIEPTRALMQSDKILSFLESRLSGLRRVRDPDPLEGLISSILSQQITIRYAATLRARLVQRFGATGEFDGVTSHAFPAYEALVDASEANLRKLGMTVTKARAISFAARAAERGELDLEQMKRASDSALIAHLTSFPGVGRWTAEWFLINVLGRMAVVPAGDLGIRKETGRWFFSGETPSELQTRHFYSRFGDVQGYVAYYVLSAKRAGIDPPVQNQGTASASR